MQDLEAAPGTHHLQWAEAAPYHPDADCDRNLWPVLGPLSQPPFLSSFPLTIRLHPETFHLFLARLAALARQRADLAQHELYLECIVPSTQGLFLLGS